MNNKRFCTLVIATVLVTMALLMIAATTATWQRSCNGSVVAEKTAGVWMITCKVGGEGNIKVIVGGETIDDPTPWPRNATTEAIWSGTATVSPSPQPTFDPYLPPVVYP